MAINQKILDFAQEYVDTYKLDPTFRVLLAAQSAYETENGAWKFTETDYNYLKIIVSDDMGTDHLVPGSDNAWYANFKDTKEAIEYIHDERFKNYESIYKATSVEDYVAILKSNNVIASDEQEKAYIDGMNKFIKDIDPDGQILKKTTATGSKIDQGAANIKAASDTGTNAQFTGKRGTPDTYTVYKVNSNPKNKTYSVPVYPDLVSVYNQVPDWALKSPLTETLENAAQDDTANSAEKTEVSSDRNATNKNTTPTSSRPKLPLYAYEIVPDDDGSCADVNLPMESIARYGDDNAQFAIQKMQTVAQRQIQFDPTKHSNAVKLPFPGKVPNNNDPFPVDLRIRDLEFHTPRIVQSEIGGVTEFELTTSKAITKISANTEKRMVQVENHLSTIMRYLFRLASIVEINDIYYGGNTQYEKYAGIRQLTDDLITDGMQTQIDQYMTSSRIEPIVGQVYEILNQVGANLSILLDNNQLSYSTMEHYCNLIDIKRYQKPLKLVNIDEDASINKSNDAAEKLLNEVWPEGYKMDWKLVPVEEQTPIINWRQSIIDDGSALMNSESLYGSLAANGYGLTGEGANIFLRTYNELSKSNIKELKQMITEGDKFAQSKAEQAKNIAKNKEVVDTMTKALEGAGLHKDFTKVALAAMLCVKDTQDYQSIVNQLKDLNTKLNNGAITNALLLTLSYFHGTETIIGDKPTKDPTDKKQEHEPLKTRLDFVYKEEETSGENTTGVKKVYFNLDIKNEATWTVEQFAYPYYINITGKRMNPAIPKELQELVNVCCMYKEVSKYFLATRFDNETWGFPIDEQHIDGMSISGWPGEQRSDHVHQGTDMPYMPDDGNPDCLAVCDGTISAVFDSGVNGVYLQSANGTGKTIVYMHCNPVYVTQGQTVTRGQPIGKLSGYSGYEDHAHIEVWSGEPKTSTLETLASLYPGEFQSWYDAYVSGGYKQLHYSTWKANH